MIHKSFWYNNHIKLVLIALEYNKIIKLMFSYIKNYISNLSFLYILFHLLFYKKRLLLGYN